MGRLKAVVLVGARGKQERLNALRAEKRVHILADGGDGHPTGKQGDCPGCPLALAQGAARRYAFWTAR
jgi:hypothetical protein